jgi:hypothetical protein
MANLNFDKKDLASWFTEDEHKKIIRELGECFAKFVIELRSAKGDLNGST